MLGFPAIFKCPLCGRGLRLIDASRIFRSQTDDGALKFTAVMERLGDMSQRRPDPSGSSLVWDVSLLHIMRILFTAAGAVHHASITMTKVHAEVSTWWLGTVFDRVIPTPAVETRSWWWVQSWIGRYDTQVIEHYSCGPWNKWRYTSRSARKKHSSGHTFGWKSAHLLPCIGLFVTVIKIWVSRNIVAGLNLSMATGFFLRPLEPRQPLFCFGSWTSVASEQHVDESAMSSNTSSSPQIRGSVTGTMPCRATTPVGLTSFNFSKGAENKFRVL